jgi:hypothetical protein
MSDTLIEDYFGHDLTDEEAERLALERVNKDLLKKEAGLYRTKWFDYRHLHHVKATYLFVAFFTKAIQAAVARYADVERAPFVKGYRGTDFMELRKADITGFWKARQALDEKGIPYGTGLHFAMQFCYRHNRSYAPRPSHLYHPEMLDAMNEHWLEMTRARIYVASDPWFLPSSYQGHPDQDDHQTWISEQIEKRAAPEYALASLVYDCGVYHEGIAEHRFGKRVLERAHEIAS